LAEKQFERRIEGRHEKCVGTVQAQRAVATMTLKAGPSRMGQAGMAAESEVSITLAVARRRLFDLADWAARATTHTTPKEPGRETQKRKEVGQGIWRRRTEHTCYVVSRGGGSG
jgi:hypothetical protein